jgi:TRAP-type mannitol/chloroaromatic compound transport system permease small subunit
VIFLAWVSFDYVMMSWSLFEGSREAGGLPFLYVMKSYILILAGMLFLQGIASIGRSILSLRGGAA